jgi:hypothetical protein
MIKEFVPTPFVITLSLGAIPKWTKSFFVKLFLPSFLCLIDIFFLQLAIEKKTRT